MALAAVSPSSPESEDLHNIGHVVEVLSQEDPGITISKIRFWEREGLVTPTRTPSGYRKFSTGDIERLRYVSRMQREHFLRLDVIAEHLDAMDRGLLPPALPPTVPTVPVVQLAEHGTPSAESFLAQDSLRISRRELVKIAGISEETLTDLEQAGFITAQRGTGYYSSDALLVARTVVELAEHGLESRHLRQVKSAAEREAGLIEQIVAGLRAGHDESSESRADERAAAVASLVVRLYATLLKTALR